MHSLAPTPLAGDPFDPVLDATFKGFPHGSPPRRRSEIGAQGWNVAAGDLPLPVAVLRRSALARNIGWMQALATRAGIGLAPHGKTTQSPQILRRQLEAGAWGVTFANVTQMQAGLAAGARNFLVANQVVGADDLAAIAALCENAPEVRVLFLLDSREQLALLEATTPARPYEVLLEIGLAGGRTGMRDHAQAMALARRAAASESVALAGLECYEGLAVTGEDAADRAMVDALFERVEAVLRDARAEGLFAAGTVLVSAGGSGIFDRVAARLGRLAGADVLGLLRSGCYVTHDDGEYRRLVSVANSRLGCPAGQGLQAALEVWTRVQSCPEPGLALLNAGKRDLSFDLGLPVPLALVPRATTVRRPVPSTWRIGALNDQHAYLRMDPADIAPAVGDRVVLGISHPCTTFDKWRWMPVVDDDGRVVDAITTLF